MTWAIYQVVNGQKHLVAEGYTSKQNAEDDIPTYAKPNCTYEVGKCKIK